MVSILSRYGQAATLVHQGASAAVRAFLQPVTDQNRASPYQVTPLGTADDRLWIFLGRDEITAGDTVVCGRERFSVRSSAAVYAGGELSHWWAALSPQREAEE
jgi:hypothetical protein